MRRAFIQSLMGLAGADKGVFLLVGDVGFSLVEPFAEEFPDRFINVGIAEQNMIGVATGMAMCGKIVFVYSLANFPTLRCLEQVRNDACYHNANVKIVASGGGLAYGALGATHHVTEDLAIMRVLPNMTVIAPGDPVEAALATRAVCERAGPCYLRLVGTGDPIVHAETPVFHIGRAIKVREGTDITLIVTGSMLDITVRSAEKLAQMGIQSRVLSMHTLKPLDVESVRSAAEETRAIITIEEHSLAGGLGSMVAEVIAEMDGSRVKFKRVALADSFCKIVGSRDFLRNASGLSAEGILTEFQALMNSSSKGVKEA